MFDCCKTPAIKLPICQKNDDKKKNEGVLEAVVTITAQLTSISNVTDTKEEGVVDCCDGGLVSVDSYRHIGQEASSYEIDDVEWANSLFVRRRLFVGMLIDYCYWRYVGDPLEKAAVKGIEWTYKSDEKAMPKKGNGNVVQIVPMHHFASHLNIILQCCIPTQSVLCF
ncbi:hypothetical protein POM88_035131 [Heracleum sosnowskyi]|uniref:Uncharacterized protein n=1 Tax=Heracleum sosnowskyi TaxID=360622 RepID=A0AAD8HKU7_9APIA|nr:hypothetical protein POM88_035131 [Heracleum sosnowskyi]